VKGIDIFIKPITRSEPSNLHYKNTKLPPYAAQEVLQGISKSFGLSHRPTIEVEMKIALIQINLQIIFVGVQLRIEFFL